MSVYYNENDPFAAAWLRELIKKNLIAPGEVDERSIEDVRPDDLRGYKQCHFFAGIGGWSYALGLAGWPDDEPVWTGSCPCQPFSSAGQRKGTADERHLWPAWFHLIQECRPGVVFGEQVEAAIKQGWLDLVQTDLEGIGYTVGAVAFPACGLGAPHIRQRLYFVADSQQHERGQISAHIGRSGEGSGAQRLEQRSMHGGFGELGNTRSVGRQQFADELRSGPEGMESSWGKPIFTSEASENISAVEKREVEHRPLGCDGAANGFWRDAEWIYCRDEKYRAVEPRTFPLAHGVPNRVGKLRGYGNAIVPQVAEAFIRSYMELL